MINDSIYLDSYGILLFLFILQKQQQNNCLRGHVVVFAKITLKIS